VVEIISSLNSPIILAVTKFGRRSPSGRASNTGAVWNLRYFKSLCIRPVGLETVQVSYNSGPFKNRMSSSSGGYFHQSCHVTKACVSLNWHQRRQTCRVLRRVSWRSVLPPQSFVRTKLCVSATSVKFPLRKCGLVMTRSPVKTQEFRFRVSTRDQRSSNVHWSSWSTSHQRSVTHQVQDCADGVAFDWVIGQCPAYTFTDVCGPVKTVAARARLRSSWLSSAARTGSRRSRVRYRLTSGILTPVVDSLKPVWYLAFWLRPLVGVTSEQIRLRGALQIYNWLDLIWLYQTMILGDL